MTLGAVAVLQELVTYSSLNDRTVVAAAWAQFAIFRILLDIRLFMLCHLKHLLLWLDCQLEVPVTLEDSTLQLCAHLWVYRRILNQFFD